MFFKDFPGPLGYGLRNPSEFGYFDPIALVGRSRFHRSQKYDPVLRFLHRNMVILDSGQKFRKFCKFMIMRGKESLAPDIRLNVFNHCPGQRKPIERCSSASDLVQDDEASRSGG